VDKPIKASKKPTLALVVKRLDILISQVQRLEERMRDVEMLLSDLEDRMIVVEDTLSEGEERELVFSSDWDLVDDED